MLPVLVFPDFDPVLVHLGPLAIRWYALAYIVALVIGWRVMRRLAGWAPRVATPPRMTVRSKRSRPRPGRPVEPPTRSTTPMVTGSGRSTSWSETARTR